uniref:Uncharacterized protein n=1 Tax=Buteo japonicus TaxID=224669 RepID=A0A8C0B8C1_9AVES
MQIIKVYFLILIFFLQAEDHIASEPRIKKLEPVLLPGRHKSGI